MMHVYDILKFRALFGAAHLIYNPTKSIRSYFDTKLGCARSCNFTENTVTADNVDLCSDLYHVNIFHLYNFKYFICLFVKEEFST
jgi:hypothetical protein